MSAVTVADGRRRSPRRTTPGKRAAAVVLAAVLSATALIPIVWLAVVSFMPQDKLYSIKPQAFRPTLASYREIFAGSGAGITKAFVNSAVVSLISTALAVVFGVLGAYAIARLRPRGYRFAGALILSSRLLPPLALVVPMYIVASKVGLLDTQLALILPYAALSTPLAMWIVQGAFLDLPRELEEAALVDGCSRLRAFYSVVLPVTMPAIAAAAVMSFVLPWNDLLLSLPLTLQNAVTLPVVASRATTDVGIAWGNLGAIAVVMVVPVAIFTYFAQRWVVSGMTAGSVKG